MGALAIEARDRNDPVQLISVLGISLHQVQDFYSHSNWLEPGGVAGGRGPDWVGAGFGATPTWFDVPAAVRDAENVYSGGSTGIGRNHGSWKADGNLDLSHFSAKNRAGRPLYAEAHTAYFATRQWVRAIRAYVNNEAFWARAMNLATTPSLLAKDRHGALNISVASGHRQGQGEPCNPSFSTLSCGDRNGPGGSLLDLRGAVQDYFEPVFLESRLRTLFERNIVRVHGAADGPAFAVASSRDMQATTRFVKLEATSMSEVDNLDIPGDADMFVRAAVGGQRYVSGVINSRDTFRFPRPHAPYTFIKAVPAVGATFSTPVTSIRVRIHTGDVRFAGTDDDVYLRVNDSLRFPLDKTLYNDFERDDDDTYSVPIDGAVADGLRVGDIRYLQIEKSRDGVAGGWRLGGASRVGQRPAGGAGRLHQPLAGGQPPRAPARALQPAGGHRAGRAAVPGPVGDGRGHPGRQRPHRHQSGGLAPRHGDHLRARVGDPRGHERRRQPVRRPPGRRRPRPPGLARSTITPVCRPSCSPARPPRRRSRPTCASPPSSSRPASPSPTPARARPGRSWSRSTAPATSPIPAWRRARPSSSPPPSRAPGAPLLRDRRLGAAGGRVRRDQQRRPHRARDLLSPGARRPAVILRVSPSPRTPRREPAPRAPWLIPLWIAASSPFCFWTAANFVRAIEMLRPFLRAAGFTVRDHRLVPPVPPEPGAASARMPGAVDDAGGT